MVTETELEIADLDFVDKDFDENVCCFVCFDEPRNGGVERPAAEQ